MMDASSRKDNTLQFTRLCLLCATRGGHCHPQGWCTRHRGHRIQLLDTVEEPQERTWNPATSRKEETLAQTSVLPHVHLSSLQIFEILEQIKGSCFPPTINMHCVPGAVPIVQVAAGTTLHPAPPSKLLTLEQNRQAVSKDRDVVRPHLAGRGEFGEAQRR